jgi:hypothetical protein
MSRIDKYHLHLVVDDPTSMVAISVEDVGYPFTDIRVWMRMMPLGISQTLLSLRDIIKQRIQCINQLLVRQESKQIFNCIRMAVQRCMRESVGLVITLYQSQSLAV